MKLRGTLEKRILYNRKYIIGGLLIAIIGVLMVIINKLDIIYNIMDSLLGTFGLFYFLAFVVLITPILATIIVLAILGILILIGYDIGKKKKQMPIDQEIIWENGIVKIDEYLFDLNKVEKVVLMNQEIRLFFNQFMVKMVYNKEFDEILQLGDYQVFKITGIVSYFRSLPLIVQLFAAAILLVGVIGYCYTFVMIIIGIIAMMVGGYELIAPVIFIKRIIIVGLFVISCYLMVLHKPFMIRYFKRYLGIVAIILVFLAIPVVQDELVLYKGSDNSITDSKRNVQRVYYSNHDDQLKIYTDRQGDFAKKIYQHKNIQEYNLKWLDSNLLLIGMNDTNQALINFKVEKKKSLDQLLEKYQNKRYASKDGKTSITFLDNKVEIILDSNKSSYSINQLKKFSNEYLCIKGSMIGIWLKEDNVRIVDIPSLMKIYYLNKDEDEMLVPEPDKIIKPPIGQNEKNNVGRNVDEQINEILDQGISLFESNNNFVKIKDPKVDRYLLVKLIAQEFTRINNPGGKVDTQILNITITAGDENEFAVKVFDRQDRPGQDKINNTYLYRIKKAENYYLAGRVNETVDVNAGLTIINEPVNYDTSILIDYLYRITDHELNENQGW